jgi:DNA repair protein SbcD/Mre11
MEGEDPLVEGVRSLYNQACEAARPMGIPILAMGHCYLVAGQVSDLSERKVLGGNQHALSTTLFPDDMAYVALGHLHLPQAWDSGRIRYSGSPIPLSMPERHYHHSVTVLEVLSDGRIQQEQIRIPRALDLLRIPEKNFLPPDELLECLRKLAPRSSEDSSGKPRPFLEVGVQLDKPEATLRATIETALGGKGYLLARIDPQRTGTGQSLADSPHIHGLRELTVEDVFLKKWASVYKSDPMPVHLSALHELIDQVGQEASR